MVPLWIDPARPRLPVKAYWLLEYYCDEPACDCRRVFLDVVADGWHSRVFASIHYGWETLEFYRPWDSTPRLSNARMLKRVCLTRWVFIAIGLMCSCVMCAKRFCQTEGGQAVHKTL